jgi:hypothetical protein
MTACQLFRKALSLTFFHIGENIGRYVTKSLTLGRGGGGGGRGGGGGGGGGGGAVA